MDRPVAKLFVLLKCTNCQTEFATERTFQKVWCCGCGVSIRPGEVPSMNLPTGDKERDKADRCLSWQAPTRRTLQNVGSTKQGECENEN